MEDIHCFDGRSYSNRIESNGKTGNLFIVMAHNSHTMYPFNIANSFFMVTPFRVIRGPGALVCQKRLPVLTASRLDGQRPDPPPGERRRGSS
jgi:hypothetical protein